MNAGIKCSVRILSNVGAWNGRGLRSANGLSAGRAADRWGAPMAAQFVTLHEKPTTRTATVVNFRNRWESFDVNGDLTTVSLRSRGVWISVRHRTPDRTCPYQWSRRKTRSRRPRLTHSSSTASHYPAL